MNAVARSVPLSPGDEVLLTNHEYGAVHRIWQRACARSGAQLVVANMPPAGNAAEWTEALMAATSPRTRLMVFSHVSAPTALVLPARQICQRRAPRAFRSASTGRTRW